MLDTRVFLWLLFAVVVLLLLAIDLGWTRRTAALPTLRAATRWSITVIALALLFGGVIWLREGSVNAVQFVTGYVVELSLSVDNLLVFILVFEYLSVPSGLQPVALKWGIIGAILMRGVMIGLGTVLVHQFAWVLYLFGVLLVVTGARILMNRSSTPVSPEKNPLLRIARRVMPFSDRFEGASFFTRVHGRRIATPLLLVVLVLEWTDLVFATDSIPAIFAISRDPFIVYTSNIFAIIGLRALFFVVAGMIARFVYLRFGVAFVLMLVGIKMLVVEWIVVPPIAALAGVVGLLGVSVGASMRKDRR
jgi:tellurite resistance protein TerC